MMKRALIMALVGLGISFAGHSPARAAAVSVAGIAAPLTNAGRDALTPAGFGPCWWDVPVIGAGVAFIELLSDEEFDRHCSRYSTESAATEAPTSVAPAYQEKGAARAARERNAPAGRRPARGQEARP